MQAKLIRLLASGELGDAIYNLDGKSQVEACPGILEVETGLELELERRRFAPLYVYDALDVHAAAESSHI